MILFQVKSRLRSYSVISYPSLSNALEAVDPEKRSLFLIDQKVAELHSDLKSVSDRSVLIPATEEQKSYDQLGTTVSQLIERGLKKSSKLVVVGGGTIQDLGGFIASIFGRGIEWELIPSTLVSQSDSCIGGKTGVNFGSFKNQLGTIYPPSLVSLVPELLKTLPQLEIQSGIGEIIKTAMIAGEPMLEEIRIQLSELKEKQSDREVVLSQLALRSLRVKKRFVEEDEEDQGPRQLLNFGHTFGHAYESVSQYQIPHGIAVLLGMSTAMYFSEKLALLPQGEFQKFDGWVREYYTPYHELLSPTQGSSILAAIKLDKKNTQNHVTCILSRGPGKLERVSLDSQKGDQAIIDRMANDLNF